MIKLINYHVFWLYFDAISTRRNWIFQQTILCSALDKNLSIVLVGQTKLVSSSALGQESAIHTDNSDNNCQSLVLWAVGCSEDMIRASLRSIFSSLFQLDWGKEEDLCAWYFKSIFILFPSRKITDAIYIPSHGKNIISPATE